MKASKPAITAYLQTVVVANDAACLGCELVSDCQPVGEVTEGPKCLLDKQDVAVRVHALHSSKVSQS